MGARTMLGQAESRNKRKRIYIFTNNGNTAFTYAFKKPLSTYPLPVILIMFSNSCLIMQLLLVLSFSSCSSILLVHQTSGAKTEQTRSANDYLVHRTTLYQDRSPSCTMKNRSWPFLCVFKFFLFYINCVIVGRGSGQIRFMLYHKGHHVLLLRFKSDFWALNILNSYRF